MTILNPNSFREQLNSVLARFVATSSPINEIRAPRLAEELRQSIGRLDFVKGPFVETLPDFEKGKSLEGLQQEGVLMPEWRTLASVAPSIWSRPLHGHQEAAIRRQENYLVATGTGSGKTESFLFPLVNDILAQGDLERPGVRAILVYPLNALPPLFPQRLPMLLHDFHRILETQDGLNSAHIEGGPDWDQRSPAERELAARRLRQVHHAVLRAVDKNLDGHMW